MMHGIPRGFSRLLTQWSALLVALSAFLTSTPHAHAMLDESEKEALTQVFESYQKSKTVSELVNNLKPELDIQTLRLLQAKSQGHAGKKLPKMDVHNASRVSFKVDGKKYTIDFVSVRSELLAINGREMEFLPNESVNDRWKKLALAFASKTASVPSPIHLLFGPAYAKPRSKPASGTLSADDEVRISDNLTALLMVTMALQNGAKNTADCGSLTSAWATANNRCTEWTTNLKEPTTAAGNTLMTGGLDGAQLAARTEARANGTDEKPTRCTPKDSEFSDEDQAAIQKALSDSKTKAALEKQVESLNFDGHEVGTPDRLTGKEVQALSEANILNKTIKWKLKQIRESINQLPPDANGSTCRQKIQTCMNELVAAIKERTKSRGLKCYMNKMMDELSGKTGASPAEAPAADGKPGAGPGGGAGGKAGQGPGGGPGGNGGAALIR